MTTVLQDCQQQAMETAINFRIGQNIKAQRALPLLIQQLIQSFPKENAHQVQLLRLIVQGIHEAQEKHDWLGLADYLEYELQELLQQHI